tara:strand:+ start:109 stop:1239 length:1131 start_codon:yes stop_codon:yes gene_type:complete
MNIIGEGFPEPINEQIVQRQKIYGSGYAEGTSRSSENIIYLNANTSWCKLVSSVSIDDLTVIQNTSVKGIENINGDGLAKRFVLFNGTFDTTDGEQRAGIDLSKSLSGQNNAYGIGGTDFGIRPMMGIKSANIKHENRGSIRRATVQIKAFNKNQFDIIDTLYLRLGFSILLEWGHTMWYDNKGVLHTGSDIENSLAENFLTGKGPVTRTKTTQPDNLVEVSQTTEVKENNGVLTYSDFLKLIQQQRLKSYGNYDAMFAKVVNYHWSLLTDGSYDITLDLVSIGDVVESFKINALNTGITNTKSVKEETDVTKLSDAELITLYANRSSIGQWFYSLTNSNYSTSQTKTQDTINSSGNLGGGKADSRGIIKATGPKQ